MSAPRDLAPTASVGEQIAAALGVFVFLAALVVCVPLLVLRLGWQMAAAIDAWYDRH